MRDYIFQNRRLAPCGVNGAFDSHASAKFFSDLQVTSHYGQLGNAPGLADKPQMEFIRAALQMPEGGNPCVRA